MIESTITLYIFIITYAVGLITPYLTADRHQVIDATSPYRPVVLALVIAHCCAAFLATVVMAFGVVANAAYLAALLLITKELHNDPAARLRPAILQGLSYTAIIFIAMLAMREILGPTRHYAYLVISLAMLANATVIVAAYQKMQSLSSIYLKHIIGAALFAFVTMVLRIYQIYSEENYILGFGYEDRALFLLRLLNAVSFFVLLNAITNFHFRKLWSYERAQRAETEQAMLDSLLALAHARDNETGNHILRTKNYVRILAKNLQRKNWFDVADVDAHIEKLFAVAPLHDIGKVGIPDDVLLKPGPLDAAQWEIMKTHARLGENVLRAALPSQATAREQETASLLQLAIEIAGGHHERWDGAGYPRALAGEAIPQSARLMAVADIYDALISERPYKSKWEHGRAVAEIQRLSGSALDPQVVAAFLEEQDAFLDISQRYSD